MNERIRELAAQATKITEPDDPDYRYEFFDKEKFAELIAKEYIDLAYKEADYLDDNFERGRADDLRRWARVMERHFGVEERKENVCGND